MVEIQPLIRIYSYRIAYKITDDFIQILRIRHTSREPIEY
ncbi:MAG: type II toxin-antitoxin system RelE/ParE family toxin [Bacteroidetes bacterium]|nr:type II toxin-antitoxin system RelE/ParE family toxin [Bacteroidota bacterium]MBL7104126.1 type II toxin-antitoxin system RelE/ParE family toxin [Bacteroidales bacterium]